VNGWLLDTNILSELRRPKPERKVVAFVADQPLDLLHVSSVASPKSGSALRAFADEVQIKASNSVLTRLITSA
jgi:toxin FitB